MWNMIEEIFKEYTKSIIYILQLVILIDLFMERSAFSITRIVKYLIVSSVIFAVLGYISQLKGMAFYGIAIVLLGASICYKGKLTQKLWIFLMVMGFCYTTRVFVYVTLKALVAPEIHMWLLDKMVLEIVSLLVASTVVSLFKHSSLGSQDKKRYSQISITEFMSLSTVVIATSLATFIVDMSCIKGLDLFERPILIFVAVYIVIIGAISFILGNHNNMYKDYSQREDALKAVHASKDISLYNQLDKMNKETLAIKKDIHTQVLELKALVKEKKLETLESYIAYMETRTKISKESIVTGNTLINAILNEKQAIACEKQIIMEVNISVPENLRINSVDLCIIIANSIDHALEVAEKVEDIEKRKIKIEGIYLKGYVFFKVWSSLGGESISMLVHEVEGSNRNRVQTDYEIGAIQSSIEKYKGEFSLSTEKEWCKLELSFNTLGFA